VKRMGVRFLFKIWDIRMKQFNTYRSELLLSFKYFYLHICFSYIFLTYNSNDTNTHTLSTISRKVSLLFFLPTMVQDRLLFRSSHYIYVYIYIYINTTYGIHKQFSALLPYWKFSLLCSETCSLLHDCNIIKRICLVLMLLLLDV
jgi:hypothetical protein